jgi:hypothetical protein
MPPVVGDPEDKMVIVANGRTSGHMEGVVRDVNFSGALDFPDRGPVGFDHQVVCSPYSQGGDSGSLIVAKDTGKIVGLHVAGSKDGSVFTPIKTVQSCLNIKFRFV